MSCKIECRRKISKSLDKWDNPCTLARTRAVRSSVSWLPFLHRRRRRCGRGRRWRRWRRQHQGQFFIPQRVKEGRKDPLARCPSFSLSASLMARPHRGPPVGIPHLRLAQLLVGGSGSDFGPLLSPPPSTAGPLTPPPLSCPLPPSLRFLQFHLPVVGRKR